MGSLVLHAGSFLSAAAFATCASIALIAASEAAAAAAAVAALAGSAAGLAGSAGVAGSAAWTTTAVASVAAHARTMKLETRSRIRTTSSTGVTGAGRQPSDDDGAAAGPCQVTGNCGCGTAKRAAGCAGCAPTGRLVFMGLLVARRTRAAAADHRPPPAHDRVAFGRRGALEAEHGHGDVVRPAALVRQLDQLAAGVVQRLAHGRARDLVVAHLAVEAVGAQHERVPALGRLGERDDVHLHVRPHAHATRDHVPARVVARLLGAQLVPRHELRDQR